MVDYRHCNSWDMLYVQQHMVKTKLAYGTYIEDDYSAFSKFWVELDFPDGNYKPCNDMTAWILARNYFFIAAGLIRLYIYARRQVISCVTKASACHHTLHANHWHCLWKIPPITAVKSNVSTFIKVIWLVVNIFHWGRVAFTVFKHADIKGVRQRLTSTASLDDGYCEATIPVVKGQRVT